MSIEVAFVAGFASCALLVAPALWFLARPIVLKPAEWDEAAREAWRELERRGLTGERSEPKP